MECKNTFTFRNNDIHSKIATDLMSHVKHFANTDKTKEKEDVYKSAKTLYHTCTCIYCKILCTYKGTNKHIIIKSKVL
jgi:hypothetical protein